MKKTTPSPTPRNTHFAHTFARTHFHRMCTCANLGLPLQTEIHLTSPEFFYNNIDKGEIWWWGERGSA